MTPLSKTVHRNYDLVCSLRLFRCSSFTVPSGWLLSVCVFWKCVCVCVSVVSLYGPFWMWRVEKEWNGKRKSIVLKQVFSQRKTIKAFLKNLDCSPVSSLINQQLITQMFKKEFITEPLFCANCACVVSSYDGYSDGYQSLTSDFVCIRLELPVPKFCFSTSCP